MCCVCVCVCVCVEADVEPVSEQYHEGKLTASVVFCVCVELCGIVFVWNVSVRFPSACFCAFYVCVVRFVLGRTARLDVVVCVAVCVVVAACGRRAIGIVDHDLSRCVNSYPP